MSTAAQLYDECGLQRYFSADLRPLFTLCPFPKGAHLCQKGAPFSTFYYFVKGRAQVYTPLESGALLLQGYYTRPRWIGDAEILLCDTYFSSVQALAPSLCLGAPREAVLRAVEGDARFYHAIGQDLARMVRRNGGNTAINLSYPLKARVCAYLGYEARQQGSLSVQVNLSAATALLGASYRHLQRCLRQLEEAGVLRRERGRILLLDTALFAPIEGGGYEYA